jgi:WD40 repeat protein
MFVISGSMDTTCAIWQVQQDLGVSIALESTPLHLLYGHTAGVTAVDISIELDLAVSSSLDGTVNMHNVRSGQYMKTLNLRTQQIPDLKVLNVKLGDQRHILVYSTFSSEIKINDVTKPRVRTHASSSNTYSLKPYSNFQGLVLADLVLNKRP